MKKIFWENPYQTLLNTTVTQVDGERVLFAETIAFSFSGGQESDKAFVNDMPVLNSEIKDKFIYYYLPENHGLKVGEQVVMTIDWARRYRLMRLHFAAELILELVTHQLNLQKIGAHIAENKARIDFVCRENISPHLPAILHAYQEIIANDLPIIKAFSDETNERRYWEIAGFSKVPCGGTHVNSTAEVGNITLKRVNIGGGKERVEIRLCE